MVAIAPQTDIILLQVPLQLNQEHQLNFTNATAQYNYFNSLPKLTEYNATYMRKEGVIRYEANFEDLVGYNYVMYRNEAYGDRWFYAFITDMEYVNDNMTNIYIKTDVWQTWQFSLIWKDTFIEREHTNNDAIGANTVDENLEVGEYEIIDINYSELDTNYVCCFAVTKLPKATNTSSTNLESIEGESESVGGVLNALHFFCVHTYAAARRIIKAYDEDSTTTSDAIVNIYLVPRNCTNYNYSTGKVISTGNNATTCNGYPLIPLWDSFKTDEFNIQQSPTLSGGFRPRNQKLFCYPFSYFFATNNAGETIEYRWEDFPTETVGSSTAKTARYRKAIVPSSGVSAKLYFTNYKSYNEGNGYMEKAYSYGINFAKVPVCAWTTDYYTNWLTQNGVNMAVQTATGVASGLLQMAGGGAMGVASGLVTSASTIGNTLAQIHQAKTTPDQAKGDIATGDFTFAYPRNIISFYKMSVRPEYARIIDEYFNMYGYATHRVKKPNITGRRNWNYVKTVGCYIQTNAPQEDVQELEEMFNRGITIWHNPATFMDYSQSNPIV